MEIEDFEARVERVGDPPALWKLFTTFFRGSSIDRVIYHHFPPLGASDADMVRIAADGVPEDMVKQYVEDRLYRDNPLLQHAMDSTEPFYFDEIGELKDLGAREREFVDEVRKADLWRGLGVQVFGPHGRNGYCGMGFRTGVTRLEPQELRTTQWACQLAHLRYCALLAPILGPTPQLSRRETEVLAWVARGKTNTTIGEILGISAHTVDAHLRRIYLKLGVFDRISAAVRGIGVGLVHSEV
jgi:LuxR family transcriptional regulator/LuxR family quorum-sensing system transcriptional regulator CciR